MTIATVILRFADSDMGQFDDVKVVSVWLNPLAAPDELDRLQKEHDQDKSPFRTRALYRSVTAPVMDLVETNVRPLP